MTTAATQTRKPKAPQWAYKSCRDLPLAVFIACLCENDLSGLGGPVKARAAHFEGIYLEYCDLVGDGRLSATMQQVKEAQILAARTMRVGTSLWFLRQVWHPRIVADLKKDYPKLELNSSDEAGYQRDLDKAEALLKREDAPANPAIRNVSGNGEEKGCRDQL